MSEKGKLEDVEREIKVKIMTLIGERLDICYQIYQLITSVKGQESKLLRFFYENSEMIDSSDEVMAEVVFSDAERKTLEKSYGKMIDGVLEAILRKQYPIEQFYDELWKAIDENPLFKDEKTKVFAMYYIWIDSRVPYFQLDSGMKMGNMEFAEITRKKLEDIKKIRFILTAPMEQKTERASLLLKMLEECREEKEKTVLMVQILAINSLLNENDEEDSEE